MASKRAIVGCAIGGENVKLEDADALAGRIVQCIEPNCRKIEVAGSIRRRRPEVNDIDIVLVPRSFAWTTIIKQVQDQFYARIVKCGPKLATLKLPLPVGSTTTVDFYNTTYEKWGVLLLIRTGSKKHNIILCSRARALGMMLSAKDGVVKDGKVVASRTEEEVFKALDMRFVPPEEREV